MLRKKRGRQGRVRRAIKRLDEMYTRSLGVTFAELCDRYDSGRYRGTIAEIDVQCFRHLLEMEMP
jgi:hypothetical protein